MPPRQQRSHALRLAAYWPVGITLTSWRYLWRTTPMHRVEECGTLRQDAPPALPEGVSADELQPAEQGVGPLFHRRYAASIRDSAHTPDSLLARLGHDLNAVAPREFARFVKTAGARDRLAVGDELVVRMPGPWDGPVRVIAVSATSFRLATLAGHLEAGQIEFRAASDDGLVFEIESWARSADRLGHVLYNGVRMAKEVQLHMWISFLERTAELAGGRLTGGLRIHTRRVEEDQLGAL